jgi:hypothetical protein
MRTCKSCGARLTPERSTCPACGERCSAQTAEPAGVARALHEEAGFKRWALLAYAGICALVVFTIERELPASTLAAIPLGVATGLWFADRVFGKLGFDVWMLPIVSGSLAGAVAHAIAAGPEAALERALFLLILTTTAVVVSHFCLFAGLAAWYKLRGDG